MFINSLMDVWIFKLVALLISLVVAIVLGNFMYEKSKQK